MASVEWMQQQQSGAVHSFFPANPLQQPPATGSFFSDINPFAPQTFPQQPQNAFQDPITTQPPPAATRPSVGRPCGSLSGRKRSRDEFSECDGPTAVESSDQADVGMSGTPLISGRSSQNSTCNQKEIKFGPGMTIIDPDVGECIDAGSQTGTWAEELSESNRIRNWKQSAEVADGRPSLESRKSLRLDGRAGVDDVAAAAVARSTKDTDRDVSNALEPPLIDIATMTLGIGWTTIPDTALMMSASRGWARYIENQFGLRNVDIVWQNKSIPGYLVSAVGKGHNGYDSPGAPGYYLFDEDLTQGRLVAKSWEKALDNLRMNPHVFDGEEVLTPQPNLAVKARTIPEHGAFMPVPAQVAEHMDID